MSAVYWNDIKKPIPHRLYGATAEDAAGMQLCIDVCKKVYSSTSPALAVPVASAISDAWMVSGFSWVEFVNLLLHYGPVVVNLINDLVTALKSSGGLTLTVIQQLYSLYGKQIAEAVKAILALWGLGLPT